MKNTFVCGLDLMVTIAGVTGAACGNPTLVYAAFAWLYGRCVYAEFGDD